MLKIGSNIFENCKIPLVIENRYFIVSDDSIPFISVFFIKDGKIIFEIQENNPVENPFTEVTKTAAGIITVSDKKNDNFIFKLRPESDTSIVFGKIEGKDLSVIINDRRIIVNTNTFERNMVVGFPIGITVKLDGTITMGSQFPPELVS